uniref:Ribosomal RNA-processing protein 42 n=1 Tax=Caenorhabditis tropicalis TaxID=1561998 RepID=A0A1I7V2Q7_9PELO
MEVQISDDEKLFLIHGVESDLRNDGRSCEDFRPMILERGVLSGTNGSCRVQLGQTTDVLAGIKLELESFDTIAYPKPRQPIYFHVDFTANASTQFAGKGGDQYGEEVAAAFHAAYSRSLDFIPNLSKTLVAEGYRWKINMDVSILQWAGSFPDAISLAVIGALSDLEIPEVEVAPDDGGKVSVVLKRPRHGGNMRDEEVPVEMWKLDVTKCPLLLTVSKIGTANLVDCCPEEESCIRAQLLVGISQNPEEEKYDVTCVKQLGGGLLEMESVLEMIELAQKATKGIYEALAKRLKTEERRKPGHSFLL